MEDFELQAGKTIEKDRNRITIYDTQTGESSIVMATMLDQQLRKTRPDGSYVFSVMKPAFEPKRGDFKCLLHPDDPNREYYDTLGLATCKKANLTSKFQVTRHMQKRHKIEWQTIEQDRLDKAVEKETRAKEEDRALQRLILKQAVNKEVDYEEEDSSDNNRVLLDGEYKCTQCQKIHRETSSIGKRHLKYKE